MNTEIASPGPGPPAAAPPRRPWTLLGILLVSLSLLALTIYFKVKSTGGFNPIVALPMIPASALPDDLRAHLDCPPSRVVARMFDLNRDGVSEYFVQCLREDGGPATTAVWARRNGAWDVVARDYILGVLQTQTNGYYDLLMQMPTDPAHGRFRARRVHLTWQGTSYTES